MGPKKVLDVEISKNYYQIGNHHPQIHTRAKFHLKQIIFKFWDQVGPKKVLGVGLKFRKTTTTFIISTFVFFWVMTCYSIDNGS